ncbi:MAG: polysulfide reductase NrfD [Chloroflexi bacterium]|nr:polysulfide reductase NrfD [Chloroflexota bacterium]
MAEHGPGDGRGAHDGGRGQQADGDGLTATYERRWEVRRKRGGRSAGDEARNSYYGVPVIHKPHWEWLVVWYFFLGGLTSGSYLVATIAEWFGGAGGKPIARAGRYVSFAALLPCPILLILDLGRPERFLNMLRVFKFRSPMSVGVWGLLSYSAFSMLSTLMQAANDGLMPRRWLFSRFLRAHPARLVAFAGLGSASFLGGYTGVLLGATAVPLWAKNALLLGPLFLTSAVSTSTAAIALVLALTPRAPRESLRRLERLDALALLAELILVLAVRIVPGRVIGRPLTAGRNLWVYLLEIIGLGILAPLALQWPALAHDELPSRKRTILASALVLAGGFMLRTTMVFGGRRSADDPAATFALTASRTSPST